MAIYSIRDLEQLTGIKKHTIRIWEQRYNLITPQRTDTNIRFYTDNDLRLLFNIALLNRNGFKISKLAEMGQEEITHLVNGLSENNDSANSQIDALTFTMLNLDEGAFEHIFKNVSAEIGFERTMAELIYPLLENLKALWITKSIHPAHEKFVSHLIRRKLLRAIDDLEVTEGNEGPVFFLYLPEDELQELTLLYIYYLLRQRNFRVVYLGPGTSLKDLSDACGAVSPGYVFSIIDSPLPRQSVQNYLEQAAIAAQGSKLIFSGAQLFLHPVKLPENVTVMNGLPDTLEFLERLKK